MNSNLALLGGLPLGAVTDVWMKRIPPSPQHFVSQTVSVWQRRVRRVGWGMAGYRQWLGLDADAQAVPRGTATHLGIRSHRSSFVYLQDLVRAAFSVLGEKDKRHYGAAMTPSSTWRSNRQLPREQLGHGQATTEQI